ncbi:divalent-cation tolerance protein CutA [Novosphingobium sp. TH158]|uniref:divalent-cation tolerance protein CutA n=1 Tax=Novosphingobium sp. TH158 TaxID=2067455 RepID=UPI0020B134E5|nr:divalent-cation tolerance protein CutA [Novosphingobium sp. TH158]
MKPQGPALAWCPFPDSDSAEGCVNAVLSEKLAACANLLPGMRSIYVWQGERGEAEEVGVLFKTDAALLETLVTRLGQLHPYEDPAILAWRCDTAAPGTSAWLGALVA